MVSLLTCVFRSLEDKLKGVKLIINKNWFKYCLVQVFTFENTSRKTCFFTILVDQLLRERQSYFKVKIVVGSS